MKRIQKHLTYANVVATLALFLALAGGAAIAATAKKNSVTAKSIKDYNVTAKDLAGVRIVTGPLGSNSTAQCATNERLMTGGVRSLGPGTPQITGSYPEGNTWILQAQGNVNAIALCLKATPGS